jgi:3-deoxy-D-manno-octulosonic-acid transferase
LFGKLFYKLVTRLYPFAINLASPFSLKAKQWSSGRKDIFEKLKKEIPRGEKIIWMHAASLGEFEQGRPVIERLKTIYPTYKILVTFFSPSGYEVRKNYKGAEYIFYLPMDSAKNAGSFYDAVNPNLVIFVKYEFWYYYLYEAKKRNIPLLLISAIFRKSQPFFSSTGDLYRKMLRSFTHLFVQNEESVSLLASIGFTNNVSEAGDTRFDRVIEIANQFIPIPSIEAFCGNADVIVAGSTWLEDDKELGHYANTRKSVRFIIAPHHITKDRLKECKKLYKKSMLFSEAYIQTAGSDINTIIIDNIGMLSKLYKYATVSYVGGGFGGEGIHNVLEAAVFGMPVVHGPEYHKYFEAVELIEKGGAIAASTALELESVLDKLLLKDAAYFKRSKASLDYVLSKKGSTDKIIKFVQENRLLTN